MQKTLLSVSNIKLLCLRSTLPLCLFTLYAWYHKLYGWVCSLFTLHYY